MDENNTIQKPSTPKIAKVALYLGIGSMVAMLLSILTGWLIEVIGFVDLFRGIVIPLSIVSIVCGIIARRRIVAEGLEGLRSATTGMILGIITLSLVLIIMVAVFIFSILMLIG